jgi:hypothetical protein
VRDYFVAAEDVRWDFTPSGASLVMNHGDHAPALPAPWAKDESGHARLSTPLVLPAVYVLAYRR